ncbi:conserved hypothetical protein, partial [Trichinella spiralis]|uniref:hypothetical protein n=1 Tax=Trichinella spiralis TaxID=6334 RepID=UPI0001EFE7ED
IVWGITYLVNEEDVDETKFRMDVEPKPGHCLMKVMFYPADKSEPYEKPWKRYIYSIPFIFLSLNHLFHILRSSGMCGSNVDYIFRLAQHLREMLIKQWTLAVGGVTCGSTLLERTFT